MIRLTSARIPKGLDKHILAETVRLLFPNEKNRDYISAIEDRAEAPATESLFALALLYEEICMLPAPVDLSKLIFSRGEMGKPYFVNSCVKFNISHSKGYVAVAVSLGEELGVDIETSVLPPERALKIAERYFCDDDIQSLVRGEKSFSSLWSKKESEAKFLGESIGNLFSKEKNSEFYEVLSDTRIHAFYHGDVPISLCTKRDFSTIIYTVQ